MTLCVCHDQPKVWVKDGRKKAGGGWRCAVRRREAHTRYAATQKCREAHHRFESTPARQLYKQLHELARVRVRY